ncbi:hypothetical protein [Duganella aceris]|uniref:Oligosaccharide repeat unit polymerase n=1 Tax=Duganella aceris TaxID=2703883 RepID=A0ABX0FTK7_9BURK|nr:hypothetical protein [Duganella aceris]NGZ88032.1 hypothetical protein [Duganella aceris]
MINRNIIKASNPLRPARPVWWMHPSAIVCVFLIPAYLLLWWAGVATNGEISTAKSLFFLKGNIALLGLTGLLALGLGTFSPIRPSPARVITTRNFVGPNLLATLGVLALIGYAYWFKDLLLHPATLLAALKNSGSVTYALRSSMERSAGIASLAQLGLPFLVLYAHALWAGGKPVLTKLHRWLLIGILLSIVFRVFAWGERLALVEAAVAIGFVWVSFGELRRPWMRRLMPWLPLIGVVAVVLLFAVGEYFRSWASHYAATRTTFWGFILQRLTNYYFTALNTGAGMLTMYEWPKYTMETTLLWVHKLPVFGPMFSYLMHLRPSSYMQLYGDAEFNNPSGVFPIFADLGIAGTLTLMLLLGALAKYVYSTWRDSATIGGTMYFLFLMTFMELFRYFYLGSPRCFMVVLGFTLAILNSVKVNYEHSNPAQISGGLGSGDRLTA